MREDKDIETVYVGAVDNYAFRIDRMPVMGEFNGQKLGGHLCGYVKLPKNHPYLYLDYDRLYDQEIYSITYAEDEPDGYWIGFDYANNPDKLEGSVIVDLEALIKELKKA